MFRVLLITVLFFSSEAAKNLIQPELNPGCTACSANENILIYIKLLDAVYGEYIIHQVWDFTGHFPSILYVIGQKNSTVEIEWEGSKPTNIEAYGKIYSFATILTNLFEYNDLSDKAYFDYGDPYRRVSLRNVTWVLDESVLTDFKAKVRVRGALPGGGRRRSGGTIEIKLLLLPYEGRTSSLPRLYHSARTTVADVSLAGLAASRAFPAARFALRYVVAGDDVPAAAPAAPAALAYDVQKTVDDEYTPGVFETINLLAAGRARNLSGGFLQYRPVAYTSRQRGVGSSVTAFVQAYNRTTIPSDCLLGRYFSRYDQDSLLLQEVVASFGQTGDGQYRQTNFTAWSHSVGVGRPPKEGASVFLVVMLVLSVATPLLGLALAVAVSAYIVRNHRRGRA